MPHTRRANAANGPAPVNSVRFMVSDSKVCSGVPLKFSNIARRLPQPGQDLDLQIITPPVRLPKIDIFQYWHARFHNDPASQWIRAVFKALFRNTGA